MIPGMNIGFEEVGWFDLPDEELDSEADRIFLAALRARAESRGWACDPDDTQAFQFRNLDHDELKLVLTLGDFEQNEILFSYGLVFDGSRIFGDLVHDQTFDFELGTIAHVEAAGTPESLAERAAEWFEAIVGWRVLRREWLQYDRVIYQEWEVRRKWQALSEDRVLAHSTHRARPVAPPDRVVEVR